MDSVRFPDFKPFDDAFRRKYATLLEEYPYAAMVVEKEARNFEASDLEFMTANCQKLAHRKLGKAALLRLAQVLGPARGPSYYHKTDGFGHLSRALSDGFQRLGLVSYSKQKLLGFGRNKHLHGLSVRGDAFPRFMRAVLDRGMDAAARDEALLAPLDRQVRANFNDVRRLIEQSDIRVIVSDGDCMYFSRVMVKAADELGIPFVVLAHGYIQNRYLVTIAPIYADMFVAWTQDQADSLKESVDPADAAKVRYFGFPKPPVLTADPVPGRVLVVWDPFTIKKSEFGPEIAQLGDLFEKFRSRDLQPVLRLHPKDRSDAGLLARLSEAHIAVDRDALGTSLGAATAVVGSYSSVLVEAAAVGKPVFQIADYAPFPFESIPQVAMSAPNFADQVAIASKRPTPPYPAFDVGAFLTAVGELMQTKKRRS